MSESDTLLTCRYMCSRTCARVVLYALLLFDRLLLYLPSMPNPLAASESEAPLPYEVQIAGYVAVVVLTVRRGSMNLGSVA